MVKAMRRLLPACAVLLWEPPAGWCLVPRRCRPAPTQPSAPRICCSSIDSDIWRSDAEDSQGSDSPSLYMTDDSAASRRASARLAGAIGLPGVAAAAAAAALDERAAAGEREREPSVRAAAAASRLKLSYITSQAQLVQVGSRRAHSALVAAGQPGKGADARRGGSSARWLQGPNA